MYKRKAARVTDGFSYETFDKIYKPGSVPASPRLGRRRPFIWDDCRQSPRATYPDRDAEIHHVRSLFGLASGGVCHAVFVTKNPVRSYRTFSPFPVRPCGQAGSLFSVALSVTPDSSPGLPGCYPAPYFREARTFLSLAGAAVRSSQMCGDYDLKSKFFQVFHSIGGALTAARRRKSAIRLAALVLSASSGFSPALNFSGQKWR